MPAGPLRPEPHYLRERRLDIPLATYDVRMREAAAALSIPLYDLADR